MVDWDFPEEAWWTLLVRPGAAAVHSGHVHRHGGWVLGYQGRWGNGVMGVVGVMGTGTGKRPYLALFGLIWPYIGHYWPYIGHYWPYLALIWPYLALFVLYCTVLFC